MYSPQYGNVQARMAELAKERLQAMVRPAQGAETTMGAWTVVDHRNGQTFVYDDHDKAMAFAEQINNVRVSW